MDSWTRPMSCHLWDTSTKAHWKVVWERIPTEVSWWCEYPSEECQTLWGPFRHIFLFLYQIINILYQQLDLYCYTTLAVEICSIKMSVASLYRRQQSDRITMTSDAIRSTIPSRHSKSSLCSQHVLLPWDRPSIPILILNSRNKLTPLGLEGLPIAGIWTLLLSLNLGTGMMKKTSREDEASIYYVRRRPHFPLSVSMASNPFGNMIPGQYLSKS